MGIPAIKALALEAMKCPHRDDLEDTMEELLDCSGLPMCAGALDGTFMKIRKPEDWGDSY